VFLLVWALHKKSAKPNKSEPEAVSTGSPLIYEGDSLTVNPWLFLSNGHPVATTTPSGLPAWGPRFASGSDTASRTLHGLFGKATRLAELQN